MVYNKNYKYTKLLFFMYFFSMFPYTNLYLFTFHRIANFSFSSLYNINSIINSYFISEFQRNYVEFEFELFIHINKRLITWNLM